jgi:hypothetical protein
MRVKQFGQTKEELPMFIPTPYYEDPFWKKKPTGHLIELEQRMAEFFAQKGDAGNEALELIRLHRHEIRRMTKPYPDVPRHPLDGPVPTD